MSINQLLDQFIGGQSGTPASGSSNTGNTGNAGGISGSLANAIPAGLANKVPGGMAGGVAGGLAAGGLLGVLVGNKKMRKKMGKMAGGAVGLGGAAALGALAYGAYQKWQNNSGQTPGHTPPGTAAPQPAPSVPHQGSGVPPVPQMQHQPGVPTGYGTSTQAPTQESFQPDAAVAADGKPFQLALVKAMIAAANADGHIDTDEQKHIFDAVGKLDLDAEDKGFIFDTLRNPPSIETIAGLANGLEQASEIYLASVLAIDLDDPSEQAYLDALADKLSLPPGFTAHLEHQIVQSGRQAA